MFYWINFAFNSDMTARFGLTLIKNFWLKNSPTRMLYLMGMKFWLDVFFKYLYSKVFWPQDQRSYLWVIILTLNFVSKFRVKPALRSQVWNKEKWSFKTGDLFKEVQFIWNFTRKRWPFNTGDCLIEATTWIGLSVQ